MSWLSAFSKSGNYTWLLYKSCTINDFTATPSFASKSHANCTVSFKSCFLLFCSTRFFHTLSSLSHFCDYFFLHLISVLWFWLSLLTFIVLSQLVWFLKHHFLICRPMLTLTFKIMLHFAFQPPLISDHYTVFSIFSKRFQACLFPLL